jgi:hypothetical protein
LNARRFNICQIISWGAFFSDGTGAARMAIPTHLVTTRSKPLKVSIVPLSAVVSVSIIRSFNLSLLLFKYHFTLHPKNICVSVDADNR